MVVVDVNTEKKELPVCWQEVNTGMYERIKSVGEVDLLRLFSIMVDKNFDELKEDTSEELGMALYQATAFIFNQEEYFRNKPCPEYIYIDDKRISIPKKVEALTLEQNMLIRQAMGSVKYIEQLISFSIAVYLQPLVSGGKFNGDQVYELQNKIKQMPIDETFALGFFLSTRAQNFGRSGLSLLALRIRLRMNLMMRSRR